ncbi:hypothetical protein ACFW08_05710 [Streptomyces sp. NPDC058960]|uniref:hypothetical protein n=1 Tax=Streptomyces sp. NPDC058960 TaxID=3346679 RepID=UPI003693F56F
MAFYRDTDGAVWQDGAWESLYCIVDPVYEPDSAIGIPMPREDVERAFGPLVEVQPTGWEEI